MFSSSHERAIRICLTAIAASSLLALAGIVIFLFTEGLPLFRHVSPLDFLLGDLWYPTEDPGLFGIFPLLVGSVAVTVLSSLLAVPLGVMTAVYLAEIAPPFARRVIKPFVELLAALPSVVLGFLGMVVLAPILQDVLGAATGLNLLKASLLLATIAVLFAFTRNGQLSVAQSAVILLFFAAFLTENLMAGKREHGTEDAENRPQMTGKALARNLLGFVLGAATIVLGAQLLIDNGSALAKMIGVPDSIIAATMIAIGTSLPELVTTLTAIRKKESSLSVGNIIGANIMDLTLIMPLCSLIQGRAMLVERQGMLLDIPACLIVTAAAIVPALVSGRFKRWTGFLIGGLYIAYLAVMFTCFGV